LTFEVFSAIIDYHKGYVKMINWDEIQCEDFYDDSIDHEEHAAIDREMQEELESEMKGINNE
jgi:hypothetical protein